MAQMAAQMARIEIIKKVNHACLAVYLHAAGSHNRHADREGTKKNKIHKWRKWRHK